MTRIHPASRPPASSALGSARPHRSCSLVAVSVRFADRVVLRGVDLHVAQTDRIAIVGDNGAGKSTLLGLLSGAVAPTAGDRRVRLPGGLAVAEQQPEFASGATVAEALGERLSELRALETEMQAAAEHLALADPHRQSELLDRYAVAVEQFEARGGYDLDHRLDAALDRLGLGGIDRARPVAELSGGQRARLVLGAAVATRPELLLLDEPTNDLDEAGLAWLDAALAEHRGALVVVSHDRAFLERFADDVVSVGSGEIRRTGNGYAGYLAERVAERRRLLEAHERWAAELARQEALGDANAAQLAAIPRRTGLAGFGHGSFRARSRNHGAMSRIRIAKAHAARVRADPRLRPPDPLRFAPEFAAGAADPGDVARSGAAGAGAPGPALISVVGARVGRGPALRLSLDALEIRTGERWLVSGPNGAGKSTLLDLLAGELAPCTGSAVRSPRTRVARLRQRIAGIGDAGDVTVVEEFAAATKLPVDDAVGALERLGLLGADDLTRRLAALSVGQRRRLELAVAVTVPSDVLLLDEPTNHLAPELVDELEAAIAGYPGAVVTVTHDRLWKTRAARSGPVRRIDIAPGGLASVVTRDAAAAGA
ncbi:ABC transporter ATP-binding protein [Leucobacter zeae]|nr:ABC transporter ATP-binding protein [Leucobacter zeae]